MALCIGYLHAMHGDRAEWRSLTVYTYKFSGACMSRPLSVIACNKQSAYNYEYDMNYIIYMTIEYYDRLGIVYE